MTKFSEAMLAKISHNDQMFKVNLDKPLDISIPLHPNKNCVNAFFAPMPEAEPVRAGDFVGSTQEGGPVNFYNVHINPHGNGTHTECVGHIAKEFYSINENLKKFFALAKLISIKPVEMSNGDLMITTSQLTKALKDSDAEALIVRTLPNDRLKLVAKYSGKNPPYFEPEALAYLAEENIQHLLVDLPSVDKEEDGGALAAHKAFWQYPFDTRKSATITELIYVPDSISDGNYLLNLQICPLELDASPSKPVLYKIIGDGV
ncbi:MAG: cyclase family protein [Chitinophagales bacterium]